MKDCDALIVGGGPAGSTCAWKLREAGLDVLLLDTAVFPRDKVCAGWVTPQVVSELGLDIDDYRQGRTWQPINAFHVGMIGGPREVSTTYDRPVSFGIRRCEFDDYLLRRARVRTALGTPVSSIRKTADAWIVNEAIRTPLLVGAAGQFCPVARRLNEALPSVPLVVAQEAEFRIEPAEAAGFRTPPGVPELFFSDDFKGYGWCFRKQDYLNIGLGRIDSHSLPAATAGFLAFLQARRKIPVGFAPRMRGHAYGFFGGGLRRLVDDGVLVVGDAAGLASPQSGEGIRPAVESALLAAEIIVGAGGRYSCEALASYPGRLQARFGDGPVSRAVSRLVPAGPASWMGRALLSLPLFVEHVALDRWFLRRDQPALTSSRFAAAGRSL